MIFYNLMQKIIVNAIIIVDPHWKTFSLTFISVSVVVTILISDTECGIERNDFFIVLKAEVFSRKLDSISRLVSVHIDL